MTEAKRKLDENQKKRYYEDLQKEKDANEIARKKIVDKQEQDKRERFGDKYVPKTDVTLETKSAAKAFKDIYEKMRKIYMGRQDEMRICFTTLIIYLGKKFIFNIKRKCCQKS